MSIAGFVPKPRTKTVVCDWFAPEEGADPLQATIHTGLSFAQIDAVNALWRDAETTYAELFAAVAPHVTAWNALAFDNASGEYVTVPPPAEVGADALKAVDPLITTWLAMELGRVHLGGVEREKKAPASDGTSSPPDDANSTSRPPTGKRPRKNPKASTGKSSATT